MLTDREEMVETGKRYITVATSADDSGHVVRLLFHSVRATPGYLLRIGPC